MARGLVSSPALSACGFLDVDIGKGRVFGLDEPEREEIRRAGCFVGVLEDMAQSWPHLTSVRGMQVEKLQAAFHACRNGGGLDEEGASKDKL